MNDEPSLGIIGTGLFTAHYPSALAWEKQEREEEPQKPSGSLLDRRSKRRASGLMKGMADAYEQALLQSECDAEHVAAIFGSALGEARTMIGLLDQMWAERESPSPMAFANSVHNAASGAVSIGTKNRSFTTSVAADFDTTAMSLVEAIGLLHNGHDQVIVVCGDEDAPEKLVQENFDWGFLTGALALTADTTDPRCMATLTAPSLEPLETAEPLARSDKLERNPQIGILDLIDAVLSEREEAVRLDRGQGRGWHVNVSPSS
jgi:3-oxoacyl-(acyl-carrier-protein) synthase